MCSMCITCITHTHRIYTCYNVYAIHVHVITYTCIYLYRRDQGVAVYSPNEAHLPYRLPGSGV